MYLHQQTATVENLKYTTTFYEKLLGVGCDVEIVVDTESGNTQASIAMRAFLRSSPVFRISVDELVGVINAIKNAKSRAKLLEKLIDDATDHQLNYSTSSATLIVVQPREKKAVFTLSIGSFSREGDLDDLSDSEISDAVRRVEDLKAKVHAKVMSTK